jgi:hypothetical protein
MAISPSHINTRYLLQLLILDSELKIELDLPGGLYNCMTSIAGLILMSVIILQLAIKALIRENARACNILNYL